MSKTTTPNPVRIVMPNLNVDPGPIIRATPHPNIMPLDPAAPAPEQPGPALRIPVHFIIEGDLSLSLYPSYAPAPDDPVPFARPPIAAGRSPAPEPTPVPTPVPTRQVEPVAGPACAPFRSSLPAAQPPARSPTGPRALPPATSPVSRANDGGSTHVNLLVIAGLIVAVLLTTAFVLRTPLSNVTTTHRLDAQERAAQQQRLADQQALERATSEDLTATDAALQRLKASAAILHQQVQAAIGVPLESAIAVPPTAVRRAFLTSNSFKAAWTDLGNAAPTAAELSALTAVTTDIATRLSRHAVAESDRQQLSQLTTAIQSRQAQINSANPSFLQGHETLDNRRMAQTMPNDERR